MASGLKQPDGMGRDVATRACYRRAAGPVVPGGIAVNDHLELDIHG